MTSTRTKTTKMTDLLRQGQSIWLDYLRRDLIRSGELAGLVADGLRGMTSNPTIFEHAVSTSDDYDGTLRDLGSRGLDDAHVFESIAIDDVRQAADVFRPVYDASGGADGFVSIEVSPRLARDTDGTIAEARRLWQEVGRPNVMIKIPGTREGWPAVRRSLEDGINVNITLLFSVEHYRAVANAFFDALEARLAAGKPIDRLASVASFFVSRVDTEVDKRLERIGGGALALRGQAAIANAKLAYELFAELSASPRWAALRAKGARVQRPLWASTSTKNPAYRDVRYVEDLIGPDTVNTLPPETLRAFEDHGTVARTLAARAPDAHAVLGKLAAAGIDLADVTATLEREGIDKFAASYAQLLGVIADKRRVLGVASASR